MKISPSSFFYFFKVLIFQVVSGVKGQKVAQNDKIFCLSWLISHHIVVHNCKMIISSGIFFVFFKILKFSFVRMVKGQKMPKMTKLFHSLYLRNHISYDLHLYMLQMCERIIFAGVFCAFVKF